MKDLPKEGQKKSHGSVIEPYKDGMWQGWASFCHRTFHYFSFMCCKESWKKGEVVIFIINVRYLSWNYIL